MVIGVTITHVFKHPFEFVARTHFAKYPNDKEKMVIRINTLEKRKDYTTGIIYKKRIAICHNVIPLLLRQFSFLDVEHIELEEQSWCNMKNRHLHLRSRNLTWTSYADMREESHFRPHAENPKWTVLEQTGSIEVKGLGRLGYLMELFAKSFLQQGAQRALCIMDDLLEEKRHRNGIFVDLAQDCTAST